MPPTTPAFDLAPVETRQHLAAKVLFAAANGDRLTPEAVRTAFASNVDVGVLCDQVRKLEAEVLAWQSAVESLATSQASERAGVEMYCKQLLTSERTMAAERDELRLTLANERGEGEAPSEGWRWTSLMWLGKDLMGWANDSLQVCVCQTGYWRVWVWQTFDGSDSGRGDDRWTAREAMRKAVTAQSVASPSLT